jgi:hypothetical protein
MTTKKYKNDSVSINIGNIAKKNILPRKKSLTKKKKSGVKQFSPDSSLKKDFDSDDFSADELLTIVDKEELEEKNKEEDLKKREALKSNAIIMQKADSNTILNLPSVFNNDDVPLIPNGSDSVKIRCPQCQAKMKDRKSVV